MPPPNTLQGVFPEPKIQHKRNFIRENVRQIKEMQGFLQNMPNLPRASSVKLRTDKYHNVPSKIHNRLTRSLSTQEQDQVGSSSTSQDPMPLQRNNRSFIVDKAVGPNKQKLEIRQLRNAGQIEQSKKTSVIDVEERISHRGIQTERTDDSNKLYETGVIKYPSPAILNGLKSTRSPKRSPRRSSLNQDHGDSPSRSPVDKMENLDISDDKDFIRHNMHTIKSKSGQRQNNTIDKMKPPPNYQKGVVPKYIKERREEQNKDLVEDLDCPIGHVLLPEEERKETLRVLRQSYADRIQELNAMPVRSDTLRMQKRKQELEEELKKIDEGIKVFQRPKVFVKINV